MRKVLLDTDVFSAYLKGSSSVRQHIDNYLDNFEALSISIITKYEILSGLYHKDSHNKLEKFHQLLAFTEVVPLTDSAIEVAAQKYAETRKNGQPVDDIDLLIAGIALANDMAIATNNYKHFSKITELEIVDWVSETPHYST